MDNNREVEWAAKAYKSSDKSRWHAALWCNRVVGRYQRGGTITLAREMGVSTDTVEDLAHAYQMFLDFQAVPIYRTPVVMIRRMPYIYISHFRALYDARDRFHLDIDQCWGLLMDILQGEGSISSRDVDAHTVSRYGDTRTWDYYAAKAQKELHKALLCPDLKNKKVRRRLAKLYEFLGKNA